MPLDNELRLPPERLCEWKSDMLRRRRLHIEREDTVTIQKEGDDGLWKLFTCDPAIVCARGFVLWRARVKRLKRIVEAVSGVVAIQSSWGKNQNKRHQRAAAALGKHCEKLRYAKRQAALWEAAAMEGAG